MYVIYDEFYQTQHLQLKTSFNTPSHSIQSRCAAEGAKLSTNTLLLSAAT